MLKSLRQSLPRKMIDLLKEKVNSIIEVKSTWTYKCKQDITNAKAEATKAKGYVFDIWVFDAKGHRIPT